jgi:hypothetical protein
MTRKPELRSKLIAGNLTEKDFDLVLKYCIQLNIDKSIFVMLAVKEYLRNLQELDEYEKLTK